MGRHSKARHRNRRAVPRGMVEMVDIRTGNNHLLTPDAAAADPLVAICGLAVLPAALVDPGSGCCWDCRSTIPGQRSG